MPDTELRTAAANRARMRASEKKAAGRLRDRGWICIEPGTDDYDEFQWAMARHSMASDLVGHDGRAEA